MTRRRRLGGGPFSGGLRALLFLLLVFEETPGCAPVTTVIRPIFGTEKQQEFRVEQPLHRLGSSFRRSVETLGTAMVEGNSRGWSCNGDEIFPAMTGATSAPRRVRQPRVVHLSRRQGGPAVRDADRGREERRRGAGPRGRLRQQVRGASRRVRRPPGDRQEATGRCASSASTRSASAPTGRSSSSTAASVTPAVSASTSAGSATRGTRRSGATPRCGRRAPSPRRCRPSSRRTGPTRPARSWPGQVLSRGRAGGRRSGPGDQGLPRRLDLALKMLYFVAIESGGEEHPRSRTPTSSRTGRCARRSSTP